MQVRQALSIPRAGPRLAMLSALLAAALLLLPGVASAQSPPAAPSSVTVTRSDGSLTAAWDAVPGAASYHVTYSSDGGASWSLAAFSHTATSISVGADNAKSYVVGVRARGSGGWSGWRNSPTAGPYAPAQDSLAAAAGSPPQAPPSVTATRGNGTLQVSWSAVPGATGYNVNTSGDFKNSWTRATSNVSGTSTVLSGIDNDLPYYVAVQAVNQHGGGGWTNSAIVQTVFQATPPQSVAATHAPGGALSISWRAPANADSALVTGYDIVLSSDGRHSWTRVATGALPAPVSGVYTYTHGGVASWKTHHVAVRAVGAGGASGWANSAPVPGISAPGAPQQLSIVRGNGYLDISWRAPSGDGGSAVTGYDINLSSDGKASWTRAASGVLPSPSGGVYTQRVTAGVSNSMHYHASARATNAAGGGSWADSAVSAPSVPAAPASVIGYRGLGFIDVEWTAVSGATGYDVNYRPQGQGWTRAASGVAGTSARVTLPALTGLYHVSVRASNASGPGPWRTSALVPMAMEPAQPAAITTSRTAASFTVSWTSCDMSEAWCNGDSPVTGYLVNVSSDGGQTWTRAHTLTAYSGQALSISNADAADDYIVSVKIENRVGGIWTNKRAPAPPGPPEYMNVSTEASGTTVTSTLRWNRPAGVSGAVGYQVECQYANDSTWTSCKTVSPTESESLTAAITSTTVNKVTALRARASESGSLGAWGSPIPDPSGVVAQYQDGALKVWWQRPAGIAAQVTLGYEVECSTDDGATYTQCHASSSSPATHLTATISTAGVTDLRLRWTDGADTPAQHGAWVLSDVPSSTPPGAPTNIQRTKTNIGVSVTFTITWDRPAGETGALGYQVQCTRYDAPNTWGSCLTVGGSGLFDRIDPTTDSSLTMSGSTTAYSDIRKVRVRATADFRLVSAWTTRSTW